MCFVVDGLCFGLTPSRHVFSAYSNYSGLGKTRAEIIGLLVFVTEFVLQGDYPAAPLWLAAQKSLISIHKYIQRDREDVRGETRHCLIPNGAHMSCTKTCKYNPQPQ